MIARVLLAAILTGIAAGLVLGLIQHVRLTPLILQAETFEHVAHGHAAADGKTVSDHQDGAETWVPANGLERNFFTTLTAVLSAVGFALIVVGISFAANFPITQSNGYVWGACGFLVVSLLPAISLPPELPGMPSASTGVRQLWWVACIALSGLGLWLIASAKEMWWHMTGLANIVLPHFFAPQNPVEAGAPLPSGLVAVFVSNSLAANLAMWIVIGVGLGFALKKSEGLLTK